MENVEPSIVWPHVNSIHRWAGPPVTHVPIRLLLPYMEAINCLGIISTCRFEDRVSTHNNGITGKIYKSLVYSYGILSY